MLKDNNLFLCLSALGIECVEKRLQMLLSLLAVSLGRSSARLQHHRTPTPSSDGGNGGVWGTMADHQSSGLTWVIRQHGGKRP